MNGWMDWCLVNGLYLWIINLSLGTGVKMSEWVELGGIGKGRSGINNILWNGDIYSRTWLFRTCSQNRESHYYPLIFSCHIVKLIIYFSYSINAKLYIITKKLFDLVKEEPQELNMIIRQLHIPNTSLYAFLSVPILSSKDYDRTKPSNNRSLDKRQFLRSLADLPNVRVRLLDQFGLSHTQYFHLIQ